MVNKKMCVNRSEKSKARYENTKNLIKKWLLVLWEKLKKKLTKLSVKTENIVK